jgi:hypothetical protein
MKTITRAEWIALGGWSPDVRFAILHADGSLYISISAPEAERDEYYWREQGKEMKRVVP